MVGGRDARHAATDDHDLGRAGQGWGHVTLSSSAGPILEQLGTPDARSLDSDGGRDSRRRGSPLTFSMVSRRSQLGLVAGDAAGRDETFEEWSVGGKT
jgi:hypothetical protein